MRAKKAITPGKVLPIIHSEVHMMQSMVSRSVYESLQRPARYHVAIVNVYSPNLDCGKKTHI